MSAEPTEHTAAPSVAVATEHSGPALAGAAARAPGLFYGWVIVGFTFVAQFLTIGTVFYTFGVLLKPLTETLGADRFLVSLALSMQMVMVAALGPWVGRWIAERSIRVLMLAGSLLLALGLLLMSQIQALWQLYAAFGLIVSAGVAFAGPLPNNALLANWFVRRRGTALGISQFGISISGTVMVPIATWLVSEYGWRVTFQCLAIAPALLLAPLVWLLVVNRPEDRGLLPDGDVSDGVAPQPTPGTNWTLGTALRDRRIWLLTGVVGPGFMAVGAVVQAMHSHITDLGLSGMEASSVIVAMTLMGAIAKPLFGVLADHFDKRAVMGVSIALQMLGLFLVLQFDSRLGLMVAGTFFGLGYGALMPLFTVLIGALFGRADFGRIMGLMGPMMLPFTLVGLPLTTFVFERTGSYAPAFAGFLAFFVVAAIALLFLRLPTSAPD